jgi:hypothetical protein
LSPLGGETVMQKRPLSIAIIAWFLGISALISIYSLATMGSNPIAMKMLEQTRVPLMFLQVWGAIGCVVTLASAYAIWKGLPWGRVLYVVWSVIAIIVSFYTSPMQSLILVSIVFFVVIAAFLFTNRANEWFAARGLALKREDS